MLASRKEFPRIVSTTLKKSPILPPIVILHGLFGNKQNWKAISRGERSSASSPEPKRYNSNGKTPSDARIFAGSTQSRGIAVVFRQDDVRFDGG
jgi:hypothetical protein